MYSFNVIFSSFNVFDIGLENCCCRDDNALSMKTSQKIVCVICVKFVVWNKVALILISFTRLIFAIPQCHLTKNFAGTIISPCRRSIDCDLVCRTYTKSWMNRIHFILVAGISIKSRILSIFIIFYRNAIWFLPHSALFRIFLRCAILLIEIKIVFLKYKSHISDRQ